MENYKKQKAPKVIYTKEEEEWLVKNVLMFSKIIENKKTDGATNRDKDQAWEKITNAFNIAPPGKERTLKSLREKYMKIKQSLRDRALYFSRDSKKTGGGPPKMELPILSEAMQELSALLAPSALGLAAIFGDSDFPNANSSALQSASSKFSSSSAIFQDKREEEINSTDDVTFVLVDEEPCNEVKDGGCNREKMVQPVLSSEIAENENINLDEAALAGCSWERVNPTKLKKPLNSFLRNHRRKRNAEEIPFEKQKIHEESREHSLKKHKIELEILSCEKERYEFERERAAIECERAAFELQRTKNQLRFEKEIHEMRLAALESEILKDTS